MLLDMIRGPKRNSWVGAECGVHAYVPAFLRLQKSGPKRIKRFPVNLWNALTAYFMHSGLIRHKDKGLRVPVLDRKKVVRIVNNGDKSFLLCAGPATCIIKFNDRGEENR